MIEASERQFLEELQKQVTCDKHFACINSVVTDLCEGKYHPDLDILECLEKTNVPCKFARSFGCTFVCTCPLRRLIAKNFDRWSGDNTAVLRQAKSQ